VAIFLRRHLYTIPNHRQSQGKNPRASFSVYFLPFAGLSHFLLKFPVFPVHLVIRDKDDDGEEEEFVAEADSTAADIVENLRTRLVQN
jgi:hypothetical protein